MKVVGICGSDVQYLKVLPMVVVVLVVYVLKLEKAEVYRLPYLKSSGLGFAARKIYFKETARQIASSFTSENYVYKPSLSLFLGEIVLTWSEQENSSSLPDGL